MYPQRNHASKVESDGGKNTDQSHFVRPWTCDRIEGTRLRRMRVEVPRGCGLLSPSSLRMVGAAAELKGRETPENETTGRSMKP